MYQILFPLGNDKEHALQAVEAIVNLPGDPEESTVTVLEVFETVELADEGGFAHSGGRSDETDFPDYTDDVVDRLEDAGIETTKRHERGKPVDTIVKIAEEIDADLITLSGRKRSPTGKLVFGSVTQSVILSADRPVLTVMVN